MKHARLFGLLAAAAGVSLLSGCVVAPPGYYGQPAYYGQPGPYGPAYVEPAPVVAAPVVVAPPVSFGFYGGYYRPWGGRRHWR